ncbi:MAG TPA: hypothetical protein PLM25_05430 [Limnochordia bacterium]|nr:hypothetical protein [Limnochordia bacterium]
MTSRQGRDLGRKYVVVQLYDDKHVGVADGWARKLNRPKRKNVKHLVIHREKLDAGRLDDKTIRAFIEQHSSVEEVRKEVLQDHGQG